ncbi:unnamed protein product, partial [Orchesella dallaii]
PNPPINELVTFSPVSGHPRVSVYPRAVTPIYPKQSGPPAAQHSPPSSPTHYPSQYGAPPSDYGTPASCRSLFLHQSRHHQPKL